MRLIDLIEDGDLDIRVRVRGSKGRLARPITWCAPTEYMDPSGLLAANCLVLTNGMSLNVTNFQIWDAYVERLAGVPVCGLVFGLGVAHANLPEGLVRACEAHDVPLLELPPEVPFLLVMRHVEQAITEEHYEELRRGWDLADQCTRYAAQGGSLAGVIELVATATAARISIADRSGFELVATGSAPAGAARTTLRLPSGDPHFFKLIVEGWAGSVLLQPLLGPAAAVIAVQLSYTLSARATPHSRQTAKLMEALFDERLEDPVQLRRLATDAGFDAHRPWEAFILHAPASMEALTLRAIIWRARVRLEKAFAAVGFMEETDFTVFLVQHGITDSSLLQEARTLFDDVPELSVSVTGSEAMDELPLALGLAVRDAREGRGVRKAPEADLLSVVQGLPSSGLVALARRLFAPLDAEGSSVLRDTLTCYLRHAGNVQEACSELFIHRNTLSYRLRRIEGILGLELGNGNLHATILLAAAVLGRAAEPGSSAQDQL
ncbi:PucR family transcriptional regulator [Paenarthrobacter sp. YJN-5]|uniref:PucR family transcriptional regulator n=1 Tax=Paenarthrobacter sp. YJN-5 TaxID=2735316 RepID=UPI001877B04B|nr:PucR family transcriptional regulator [Paenarthrobacter sp. YJN-5]QOT19842.1 PucR family transcriptional regulator [Paenarthrobacter sp. YJN-5]